MFVGKLTTFRGGNNKGEVMLDGIHEANNLIFRKDSKRIYFIIGDEQPHGKEFGKTNGV